MNLSLLPDRPPQTLAIRVGCALDYHVDEPAPMLLMVQRADGYGYSFNMDSNLSAGVGHAPRAALSLPGMNAGVSRA